MSHLCTLFFQEDIHKNALKIDIIEIIIPLLSRLVFVIFGFIKNLLPNSYFILQIHQAKSFKMRHVTSLYFNISV